MDAIPNDVLKLILPLINSPVCLIRAAATCKELAPHHRRRRHPQRLPLAPRATRRRRLLQQRSLPRPAAGTPGLRAVVCEPLTRSMESISPCAGTGHGGGDGATLICAYLIDGDHNDSGGADDYGCTASIGMSNFRVLCVVYGNYRYRSRVYTSGRGGSWHEISIDRERMNRLINLMGYMGKGMAASSLQLQHRVVAEGIGSHRMDLMGITAAWLYWYTGGSTVVAVDRSTAEATSFVLPVGAEDWDCLSVSGLVRATDGPDGSVRLVVSEAGGNVKIYAWIHGAWALEKRMSIPPPTVGMGGATSSSL